MTCIAAAIVDGEICIGADAVSMHRDACVRVGTHSKVFRVGEFLIGSSGTVRLGQVVHYLFEPPPINQDLMAYMVTLFCPALRDVVKAQGCEVKTSSGTDEMDGRLVVGVRGHLFEIDSAYGAFEPRSPYTAVGCADQEAHAAMFTAWSLVEGISADRIVRAGLAAAAEFDANIRPPFTVLSLREQRADASQSRYQSAVVMDLGG